MSRFTWATFKTFDAANAELEDMFASGMVCLGENPQIVRRTTRNGTRYAIELNG